MLVSNDNFFLIFSEYSKIFKICLMSHGNLENQSCESLKYNISDAADDILLDSSCDPDSNYFNTEKKTLIPICKTRGISKLI